MPLKTTLTRKSWGWKSFATETGKKVFRWFKWSLEAMSRTVLLLWKSYWLYLNKPGIRRLTEDMCLSLNHLLQIRPINPVWCWSKMKSTVHQFSHPGPDQHLSFLSVSARILIFYQAAVPWLQKPMPQCPTSQTCQLPKDQMTLSFLCCASSL